MSLASALFGPPSCAGCGRREGPLCRGCALYLAPPRTIPFVPAIDSIVAAWEHAGPARNLILDLKLGGRRWAARVLAAAMCDAAARAGLRGDFITWVPADRRSVRTRGYDHAELLARRASQRLGLRAVRCLQRTRPAGDQAALSAKQRRANLAGAFKARPVSGAVVLVDDVLTTGATADACGRALRAAGARRVELIVACRRS